MHFGWGEFLSKEPKRQTGSSTRRKDYTMTDREGEAHPEKFQLELHSHPKMERRLGLDEDHVIIDRVVYNKLCIVLRLSDVIKTPGLIY